MAVDQVRQNWTLKGSRLGGVALASAERRADFGEEGRERVGAVMDMGRQLGPARHRLVLGMLGHAVHQDRGHADRVRGLEIMRQVVEHRGLARDDAACARVKRS